MSGYATVPIRTCGFCGDEAVCKNTDRGLECRRCEVIGEALDATLKVNPGFQALVVTIAKGEQPEMESLFEMGAALVAEGLRYAAEHPELVPYFGRSSDPNQGGTR